MRILKAVCILFCVASAASVVNGLHNIYVATYGGAVLKESIRETVLSLVLAFFWAGAFYGIHRRALIAWRIGWGVIVVAFLQFLAFVLSSVSNLPKGDNPLAASIAAIVADIVVALYWSIWWKRQRNYFTMPRPPSERWHQ